MTSAQRTNRTKTDNGLFVRVRPAGQSFGFYATVEHQNGRVVATTEATYPFADAARTAGLALSERG